mmetsp:Transcript_21945/g.57265  ORF Transcript_21945/g.57265 Transcript_21945/m.57265 type:complete len:209 (+) Transcript_21945:389-1015(+)
MNACVHTIAGGHDIVPERSEQDAEEHDGDARAVGEGFVRGARLRDARAAVDRTKPKEKAEEKRERIPPRPVGLRTLALVVSHEFFQSLLADAMDRVVARAVVEAAIDVGGDHPAVLAPRPVIRLVRLAPWHVLRVGARRPAPRFLRVAAVEAHERGALRPASLEFLAGHATRDRVEDSVELLLRGDARDDVAAFFRAHLRRTLVEGVP